MLHLDFGTVMVAIFLDNCRLKSEHLSIWISNNSRFWTPTVLKMYFPSVWLTLLLSIFTNLDVYQTIYFLLKKLAAHNCNRKCTTHRQKFNWDGQIKVRRSWQVATKAEKYHKNKKVTASLIGEKGSLWKPIKQELAIVDSPYHRYRS